MMRTSVSRYKTAKAIKRTIILRQCEFSVAINVEFFDFLSLPLSESEVKNIQNNSHITVQVFCVRSRRQNRFKYYRHFRPCLIVTQLRSHQDRRKGTHCIRPLCGTCTCTTWNAHNNGRTVVSSTKFHNRSHRSLALISSYAVNSMLEHFVHECE